MKLQTYMDRHGLDDLAMSELVGCDRSTIYRLRNGMTRPLIDQIAKIVRVTGGLVGIDDFPKPRTKAKQKSHLRAAP